MLTPRRLLEMKHGSAFLVHRIEEGGCLSFDQLPNPAAFSGRDNPSDDSNDAARCGTALAESFMKLIRPHSEESFCEPDGGSSWLADYVEAMPSRDMRGSFLSHLDTLLQIALLCPERLPTVAARLDALDNVALQEQATKAFCWESTGERPDGIPIFFGDDGGIFAGLLEGE